MAIRTIFLDRDGVINKETKYLYKIEDFKFINGVFNTCIYLQNLGYDIIIITNQSGISRGYFKESDYKEITKWMLNQFLINNIKILDIYHCPHNSESKCNCRKPQPGMFLNAKENHNIDMSLSWAIGDKETDISAAHNAGIVNTILVRSGHQIDEKNSRAKFIFNSINEVNQLIKK